MKRIKLPLLLARHILVKWATLGKNITYKGGSSKWAADSDFYHSETRRLVAYDEIQGVKAIRLSRGSDDVVDTKENSTHLREEGFLEFLGTQGIYPELEGEENYKEIFNHQRFWLGNNQIESEKRQQLLFDLGYRWMNSGITILKIFDKYVKLYKDGDIVTTDNLTLSQVSITEVEKAKHLINNNNNIKTNQDEQTKGSRIIIPSKNPTVRIGDPIQGTRIKGKTYSVKVKSGHVGNRVSGRDFTGGSRQGDTDYPF